MDVAMKQCGVRREAGRERAQAAPEWLARLRRRLLRSEVEWSAVRCALTARQTGKPGARQKACGVHELSRASTRLQIWISSESPTRGSELKGSGGGGGMVWG